MVYYVEKFMLKAVKKLSTITEKNTATSEWTHAEVYSSKKYR
jgi:hypothetical protein